MIITGIFFYKKTKSIKEKPNEHKELNSQFLGATKVVDNLNNTLLSKTEINKKDIPPKKEIKKKKIYQDYNEQEGSQDKEEKNNNSIPLINEDSRPAIKTSKNKITSKSKEELLEDNDIPRNEVLEDINSVIPVKEVLIEQTFNSENVEQPSSSSSENSGYEGGDLWGELSEEDQKRLEEWNRQEAELLAIAQKEIEESNQASKPYAPISQDDSPLQDAILDDDVLDQILAMEEAARKESIEMSKSSKSSGKNSKKNNK